MMLQQQTDHRMVYGMQCLFQNEVLLIYNDDHVQHEIQHTDHIVETQSETDVLYTIILSNCYHNQPIIPHYWI